MQPERTALSWRRTALSMGVGSIAALRVFPAVFGAWALVPTGIAVILAVLVFVFAQLRYRRNHRALLEGRALGTRPPLADGRMIALVALVTICFALIAAGLLVASILRG
jgi:putative membrane protein